MIDGRTPFAIAWIEPGPGRPESYSLRDRLLTWAYVDNESKADELTLTLDNEDLALFDEPAIATGNSVIFSWGFGELLSPARRFVIRKPTGGTTISMECHGEEVLMDSEPKRESFSGLTVSEAVVEVLRAAGFAEDQIVVTPTTTKIATQNQGGATDMQFIARAARRLGWIFYLAADGSFHFEPRGVEAPPALVLGWRRAANGEHPITDFSVEEDLTRRPGKVTVQGRDPDTKTDVEAVASEATEADRPTLSQYVGTFDPETGDLVVGSRPVGSVGQAAVAPVGAAVTAAEAAETASGQRRGVVQRGVKMSITCPGHPFLSARSVVQVVGLGQRLSGPYWVSSASHSGGAGDYSMSLELITEGFQRGRGGGGGGASGDAAALPGAWSAASLAVAGDPNASLDLLDGLEQIETLMVPGWESDPGAVEAIRTRATHLAQIASSATPAATAAATALGNFAAQCHASRTAGSDETSGAPNTQDAQPTTGVNTTGDIDPETGELVVRYNPA